MPSPTPAMPAHDFPFDPSYGYQLKGLLAIEPPAPPEGFAAFWQARYRCALLVDPQPRLSPSRHRHPGFTVFDLE